MNSFFSDSDKNRYIKEKLEKQLIKYGKISYAYAVMNKKNTDDISIITDLKPDFVEMYLEKKYQNIDPVVINAINRVSSFVWDDSLKINSYWPMGKVFVVDSYNIMCGHTFVLHDQHNNLATLSLYFDKFLMADVGENIMKFKNDIQAVLIDTHEMLLEVYKKSAEKLTMKTVLSPREAEILYWSSIGKTYPEVAEILNITVSTVKFHMGKTVKKLGVKNAKHAISLANELNLISPPLLK